MSRGFLFTSRADPYAVLLQSIRAAASKNDEALKSMQDYQKGLQQRLQDHEQELKAAKSNQAPAGGSSRSLDSSCPVHVSIRHESLFDAHWAVTVWAACLTCALMVPGFRVAAAAVEAEAGPDLRELTIDDWDSALEEAGDTLVVVDFFTNWYITCITWTQDAQGCVCHHCCSQHLMLTM